MFNLDLLFENLTNPALLFLILGILAVCVKSDLEIPPTSAKFISLYLLFSIGFRGGQELAHETFDTEIIKSIIFGLLLSAVIPLMYFYILKMKFGVFDAGAIAATYGSISAVTFITAVSYLESLQQPIHGQMVAIMALMESPAIIVSLILVSLYSTSSSNASPLGSSFAKTCSASLGSPLPRTRKSDSSNPIALISVTISGEVIGYSQITSNVVTSQFVFSGKSNGNFWIGVVDTFSSVITLQWLRCDFKSS
jgi:hypothetical protein